MKLVRDISVTSGALRIGPAFSPARLFAAGEPGLWLDPSDLTTLFQDSAGATPVTAAGQPVGRVLDKSGGGRHATQATAALRPTYGVVPRGGRRNLLTYTEQIDNAAWTKISATVSANAGAAPDGASTADKIIPNAAASNGNVAQSVTVTIAAHTVSFYAKAAGQSVLSLVCNLTGTFRALIFNLGTGVATTATGWTVSMTAVGDGWYRCFATATADVAASKAFQFGNNSAGWTGDGTTGFLLWGVQVEAGSAATAYQRVVSAFDVTETGTVSLSYLSFDGVDDFLVTPTITPGTDKVQMFAGVRKLSDAAQGVVAELSASAAANNGSLLLAAPDGASATFAFDSKGTIQTDAVAAGQTAPLTAVLTGLGDIAGDSAIIRVNGAVADTDTGDQGTGNYLAYPIYIGRRGGTALPFSGGVYGLIARFGAALSGQQITLAERWLNAKTGAF